MPLIGILAALTTVTLWGGNFIAVKVAVGEVPALCLSALRFTLLVLLLSPFLRIPRGHFRPLIVYALIMGVGHFSILFVAMQFIDISTAGIVLQLGTPFIVLLAWLMLKESFGIWRCMGMLSAFGGIVVLIGFPSGDIKPWHMGILVVASFTWALGTIKAKQLPAIPPFSLIAWMATIVAPILWVLSAVFEHGQIAALQAADLDFWLSVAYMTLASSTAAYGLWYYLIKRYDVTVVAPFNLLVPLVAVAGGVTVMGDEMTWSKIVGGAMILGGVSLITVRDVIRARRARRAR